MQLSKPSPCKVNLLLNVLGKRADGFHELETIIQPINFHDELQFERIEKGVHLTCGEPLLPIDSRNLVFRAATAFFQASGVDGGVRIHLIKRIPLAAGLGGGSSNAATTLSALNELFGNPVTGGHLQEIAASLGSDVPFFLHGRPALATGRGDKIEVLEPFAALRGTYFLLVYPGFGVSTAWAYQQLASFPEVLNAKLGRAQRLMALLAKPDLGAASAEFYNSLETPVFEKYPLIAIIKDFLQAKGVALMSGSGSTIFCILPTEAQALKLEEQVRAKFHPSWTAVVPA